MTLIPSAVVGQVRKFTNLKYFNDRILFSQYRDYPTLDIVLEIVAIFWFTECLVCKKDNILVFQQDWLAHRSLSIYCGNGLCGAI
jgi:hypothetical protein